MSASLKITGQTYTYRETLKSMGGKFDGVTKAWTVADTIAAREAVAKMDGVFYAPTTDEFKPPMKPTEQNFQRAFNKPVPSDPIVRMPQDVIGNSDEHIRTFGPATNFSGFDSLNAFVEFLEKIPSQIANDPRRDNGWREDGQRYEFTKTSSMSKAIKLTRDGWAEGVEMASKVAERISGQQPTKRARVHSVAGGSVNVGRMLSGNPLHMRQRVKQPAHKVVTLIHTFNNSHTVDAGDMEIRAAVVAAIADTLENNGFSCEILAAANNVYGLEKGYETNRDRHAIDVIKLKSAGDRLNLSDVMFGLGHPSFLRRFAFARWACIEPFPYKGMGYVGTVKTEISNTFIIGHLPHKFTTKNMSFDEKLAVIVKAIVPDNLPLEFKFNA